MSNLPTATQAGADAKPRSLISLNVGPTAWLAVRAGTLGAAFALATSIRKNQCPSSLFVLG